jgi:hypothetical protein
LLRVGVQHVTEAFPHVLALVQAPSDRVLGKGKLRPALGQHLLQQWNGPTRGKVAKLPWAPGQHRREEFLPPFIPKQRTALAGLLAEPFKAGVGSVAFDPTVEAARGNAQLAGHLPKGSTRIEFE